MNRIRKWLLRVIASGDSVVLNTTIYGKLDMRERGFIYESSFMPALRDDAPTVQHSRQSVG